MKVIHVSDTHTLHQELDLPAADCLIVSGDFLNYGERHELIKFNAWLGTQKSKFKYSIVVAGNHDRIFERDNAFARSLLTNATHYLQDEEVTIEGIRIYGSPWQPAFCNWAFNLHTPEELKAKWDLIPDGIDILVTHCPPRGFRDYVMRSGGYLQHLGCEELTKTVLKVKPKFHLFGHIHYANGMETFHGITFINSAVCDELYNPSQSYHEFEIVK